VGGKPTECFFSDYFEIESVIESLIRPSVPKQPYIPVFEADVKKNFLDYLRGVRKNYMYSPEFFFVVLVVYSLYSGGCGDDY
jgi:hypothetical protein